MGFGDKIRAFFSKRSSPALLELDAFARGRKGLEGFLEPQTATNPPSLLLVDREGEHLRGPLREPRDGVAFCNERGIPVYDAQVVGYPRRMKDHERRRQRTSPEDIDARFAEIEKRLSEDDRPE